MKKILIIGILASMIYACGGEKSTGDAAASGPAKSMVADDSADDGKGVGEFSNIVMNNPLDQDMAGKGKEVYDMKCSACHKLTANRVVGPGFKGVTERRKPEWILNMITNTEMMLDKDPEAQKMLEECLTRMPNQNLSKDDARNVLEFLAVNDASGN